MKSFSRNERGYLSLTELLEIDNNENFMDKSCGNFFDNPTNCELFYLFLKKSNKTKQSYEEFIASLLNCGFLDIVKRYDLIDRIPKISIHLHPVVFFLVAYYLHPELLLEKIYES